MMTRFKVGFFKGLCGDIDTFFHQSSPGEIKSWPSFINTDLRNQALLEFK